MQAEANDLMDRYGRIISALFAVVTAHNRVLARWLFPLFDRLILVHSSRALNLLGRLTGGVFRRRRPGLTRRPAATRPAPQASQFASILPMAWKWLTRALPSPVHEAAQAAGAELQALLSEPASIAIFAAAPALRRHLRPIARALGVTLPGEKPPRDPGPETPPPAPEPPPPPGTGLYGRAPEQPTTGPRVIFIPSFAREKNWA